MRKRLSPWWTADRRRPKRLLGVECLEDRTLLSGSTLATALPLAFTAFQTAHTASFLSAPDQVDLYRIRLNGGDRVSAAVSAQTAGSGLQSVLRVFDGSGTPLALDDQEGGDPRLTFQAATAGDYFVGVSSAGDDRYNPTVANSRTAGVSTGLYSLDVRLTPGTALQPDVTGSSFRLGAAVAVPSEAVPVAFAVENRGGADPGNFTVEVLLSSDLATGPYQVAAVFARADLVPDATGQRFSAPAGFTVTVPFGQAPGPLSVALFVLPDPLVPDSSSQDKFNDHRGSDFETLTVLAPVPAGTTDLTAADPGLNTRATGALVTPDQVATYTLTVPLGANPTGRLTAQVATTAGTLVPRLTLQGPDGRTLIQSDDGSMTEHLQPGRYTLVISSRAGAGSYRLDTEFTAASPPLHPVLVGVPPLGVTVADVNGDGTPDLIVANKLGDTIGLLLGNGHGTFQPEQTLVVGNYPEAVAVADVNGDGIPDLVVANEGDNTVSVLLGQGNRAFQIARTFATGSGPVAVAVADVNGDGKPDLVVANYFGGTVGVFLGDGHGGFQAQQTFAVGANPHSVAVADVDADGTPDLVTANVGSNNVSVLLGDGHGNFPTRETFPVGTYPRSVAVADVNGDGLLDLVTANYGSGNVSVLRGDGHGGFAPEQTLKAGTHPNSVAVADVNGDGVPDLVTANYGSNDVSVLLGDGHGGFAPQQTFAAGPAPLSVAVTDVNGDGKPDAVVADYGDKSVGVLLGDGHGRFQPRQSFPVSSGALSAATADLNKDGNADLVVVNALDDTVSVLLGNGDGSFQPQRTFSVGLRPQSVAVADVNGDGTPDLVVANAYGNNVSVLLGNGDGTFQFQQTFATGSTPVAVAVGDVNGDGLPDIVTANLNGNSVSVLLADGHGGFTTEAPLPVGTNPRSVAVADVNGDGALDIITANANSANLSVLLGKGDGTFQGQYVLPVGRYPQSVAVADFNGDGKPDLVVVNHSDFSVGVLLGDGRGGFQAEQTFPVGGYPDAVAVADFNGDGNPDLVVTNRYDSTVAVLLGDGKGAFAAQRTFPTGVGPYAVAVADFNGDGRPDLVATNDGVRGGTGNTVSVLLGNGDGSFQVQPVASAHSRPVGLAVADVNGDGKPDVAVANFNYRVNTASVLLGDGNGSFQAAQALAAGSDPYAVALADLNGDGKPDLVVANSGASGSGAGTVSVLLGNGDGTFQPQKTFATGAPPVAVTVADVNGDGVPDLATANYHGNSVSVLLGNGDGSFRPGPTVAAGSGPQSVAVADVNGDGFPDLIVADVNPAASAVRVLLGDGHGGFRPQMPLPVGSRPVQVVVADVNGDGNPDLIVANLGDNTVGVLLGDGHGNFASEKVFTVGSYPDSVAVADVNGDGIPDLVVANSTGNSVSILLGNGDGTFQTQQVFPVGAHPDAVAVVDVNGDGKLDLVTANSDANTITVLLGNGAGSFTPGPAAGGGPRNTPTLVDLNGDGVADSAVLNGAGTLLFRKGVPGGNNAFVPPVPLNDAAVLGKGRPARDLTVVHTGSGQALATADANFDPGLSTGNSFIYTVSLYTLNGSGAATRATAFTTAALPTRIAAADLTDPSGTVNGRDDLVVASSLGNSVTVAFQTAPGVFDQHTIGLPVGITPSDIAFVDVNGDGLLDIVVSDEASGDVTVLLNDSMHSFQQSERFRGGISLSGIDTSSGSVRVVSLGQPASLAVGAFTERNGHDVVVVNGGTHSFSVLANDGSGLADPQAARTTSTSDGAAVNDRLGPVVAADFHARDGLDFRRVARDDVAILMKDRGEVWIFTNRGDGTFKHTFSIAVGPDASGLSVVPGSSPGRFDLLVGTTFGDVLRLVGQGNGTFQPLPFTGDRSPLAQTVGSSGQPELLVADQSHNAVTIQTPTAGGQQFTAVKSLVAAPQAAAFAPGAVQWTRLEGNQSPFPDAMVVASGSNAVQVYRFIGFDASGQPGFAAAASYPVGTNPVSVTIADLNGDGIPDVLVANQGSNDISVLLGSIDPATGSWVATSGPRLKSGGLGPIATTLRDVNGDGIPDLIVTNAQGGTLTVLPGRGLGFFDDRNPQVISLGGTLGAPSVGNDLGVVPNGDGLVAFDPGNPGGSTRTVFTSAAAVDAVQVLPGGAVVVALTGGTVEELLPDATGVLTVAFTFEPLSGVPADPSALAVLPTATGLEVLVTESGADQVFVFAAPGLPELPVPMPAAPPGPEVAVSVPEGVPEAVVVTFGTDQAPTAGAAEKAAAEEAPAEAVAFVHSASAVSPGRADGEEDTGQEETRTEGEAAVAPDEYLRNLDLYVPVPDVEPDDPGVARPAPRLAPGEAARTGLADDDLLPPWPADALLPPPDSLPTAPPPPAGSPQPDDSGRPAPDATTPPPAAATVEPPARTSDRGGAEKPTAARPGAALSEEACDAVFLPPAHEDRDLAFLIAVTLAGFELWADRRRAEPSVCADPAHSDSPLGVCP